MNERLNIVFCGQVRSEARFRAAVEKFGQARRNGVIDQIVYSTWLGELGKYPELDDFLRGAGVEIVESPLPTAYVEAQGSFFYQCVQLNRGLERVEPEALVVKTRPDILLNAAIDFGRFFSFLAKEGLPKSVPVGSGLQASVGIFSYDTYVPFWSEDRIFYGICSDLRQLGRLSRIGDMLCHQGNLIAEVRWYSTIFIERFPVFMHVMRVFWMLRYAQDRSDPAPYFSLFRHKIIYEAIAVFHYLLDTYFVIGLPEHCYDFSVFTDSNEPRPFVFGVRPKLENGTSEMLDAYREMRSALESAGPQILTEPAIIRRFREGINAISKEGSSSDLVVAGPN